MIGQQKRTTIKGLLNDFGQQLSFVYAARRGENGLAPFVRDGEWLRAETLLETLDQRLEAEHIRSFLAYAKTAMESCNQKLAAELRESWDQLPTLCLEELGLLPLTPEEQQELQPKPRRRASETKKAARKKPPPIK